MAKKVPRDCQARPCVTSACAKAVPIDCPLPRYCQGIAKALPGHCQGIAKALPSPCKVLAKLSLRHDLTNHYQAQSYIASACPSACAKAMPIFLGIAKLFSKNWNAVALLNNSKPLTRHGQAIFDREQYHPNCWLHLALEFCLNAILINYHANVYDTFLLILRSKFFTLRTLIIHCKNQPSIVVIVLV